MSSELTELKRQSNQLVTLYNREFAGRPRTSRELSVLNSVVERATNIAGRLASYPSTPELEHDLARARKNVDLYAEELRSTEHAQSVDVAFVRLASRSSSLFARFGRQFAGQPRASRDITLLDDICAELVRIEVAMRATLSPSSPRAQRDVEAVGRAIACVRAEAVAIAEAQQMGSFEERRDLLDSLLRDQQQLFARHIAGRSRARVRVGLGRRLIHAVERIQLRMDDLRKAGFHDRALEHQQQLAGSLLATWRVDCEALEKASATLWPVTVVKALEEEREKCDVTYDSVFRGRHMMAVDADRLNTLCDDVHEIVQRLDEVPHGQRDQTHGDCLDGALTSLLRFEGARGGAARMRVPRM